MASTAAREASLCTGRVGPFRWLTLASLFSPTTSRSQAARAWSMRFFERQHAMPSTIQAGVYSVTLGYLKAVAAAGTTERAAVIRKLHQLPIHDAVIRNASLRPDGRVDHETYLFRVKTPAESKEPFDFYERIATTEAGNAFRPLAKSLCPKEKWYNGTGE